MLNAIAGVWPIDVGSIVIDGVDMTGLSEHKRAPVSWQSFSGSYEWNGSDNGDY